MKYALMATVTLSTNATRDGLTIELRDKILSKILWGGQPNVVGEGRTEDGKPFMATELRFENKAERDEIATWLQNRIDQIPALSGTVQKHKCYHDEGDNHPPCEEET